MTDLTCFGVVMSNSISLSNHVAVGIITIIMSAGLRLMVTVVGAGDTGMESPHRKTQEEVRNKECNKEDIPCIFFSVKLI